jgi:ParB-like chromosome segregation protein Spo0J
MTPAEFSELKSDIQSNGCHTPIELYEGQILDGRHRYLACCELGKDYVTNTYRGDDPVGFVRSLNLHRRNLTAAQRAMVEVSLAEWCDRGNLSKSVLNTDFDLPEKPAKTAAEMAKEADVSTATIEKAKAIVRSATPEVKEAVTQGAMSLQSAAKTLPSKPKPEPPTPRPLPEKTLLTFPKDIEKAVARLGRLFDAETESAYRRGTIKPQDIAIIKTLKDGEIRKIEGLVCRAGGWTVKRALRFIRETVDEKSRIEVLISKCIQSKGRFETTIHGHKISVTKEGGYQ